MTSDLHRAGLLVCAPLCCGLKTVGLPLAWGPVSGSKHLHEVLQADHTVVGRQRPQLEELPVRNMNLKNREKEHYATVSLLVQPHEAARWHDFGPIRDFREMKAPRLKFKLEDSSVTPASSKRSSAAAHQHRPMPHHSQSPINLPFIKIFIHDAICFPAVLSQLLHHFYASGSFRLPPPVWCQGGVPSAEEL